jgi:hypothetical protein
MADAMAEYKKMLVKELRDELQSRGLDTSGTKAVLLERLEEALAASATAAPAAAAAPKAEATPAAAPAATKEHVAAPAPAVGSTPAAPAAEVAAVAPVPEAEGGAMTEEEKRKRRAERFGIPVVEAAPQGGCVLAGHL